MKRTGTTLLDVISAAVAVATLVTLSVQIAASTSHERREGERRVRAQIEAANAMERINALAWSELSPDKKLPIELGEAARQSLPGALLKIDVQAVDATADAPAARRVRVELTWHDRAGQTVKPVQLTQWFYPPRGGEMP